jgi:hypothetical protein
MTPSNIGRTKSNGWLVRRAQRHHGRPARVEPRARSGGPFA